MSDFVFERNDPDVWSTRDGRAIPVRDMSDAHLEATMLKLATGPQPRGEMAQDAFEMELAGLERDGWQVWLRRAVPQYPTMLAEQKRRREGGE